MKNVIYKLVAVAALLAGAPSAFAQNLAVPAQTGVINGAGQTFTINFTPGADSGGFDFVLNATPAANLTITAATATIPNGTTVCTVTASSVTCFSNANAPTTDLGAGSISVTYTGGATAGPINLNFASSNFFSQAGPAEPGTTTNGVLTLNAGPSGPSLTYNPATGPITVAASGSGTAITGNIAVTAAGGDTGQSTALACSVTGAGFAPPVVTGSPFPGGSTTTGSVGLACAGSATTGSLSCTQTRSGTGGGAPIVTTFALNCTSAPGFASTPANGGTLALVGIQGGTTSGAVAVSNPGTAALTLSGCAATGAGFTLGTPTASIAAGGTGTIPVTCAVPTAAGQTITGSLTCTTNAAAPNATITYNLSCLSQSASIPTLGFGGKALMVLLMLGFGLVGFQLYRRSA